MTQTRRSKLCSLSKGRVYGYDNVDGNDGLYWDELGCNWAALGSTGLAWTVVDCTGLYGAVIYYWTVLEYTGL